MGGDERRAAMGSTAAGAVAGTVTALIAGGLDLLGDGTPARFVTGVLLLAATAALAALAARAGYARVAVAGGALAGAALVTSAVRDAEAPGATAGLAVAVAVALGLRAHRAEAATAHLTRVAGPGRDVVAAVGRPHGDERIEASVLFCDLRDFTPQAAASTPEATRALLERYYEHVSTHVGAHGGAVVQYVGDEVLAAFGLDGRGGRPSDALACARSLQSVEVPPIDGLLGSPLRYGIGVHTGDLVLGSVGGAAHRQVSVVGDTVNVGARLVAMAGPGEIVVSHEVRTRATPRPQVDELAHLVLKGIARPVRAYRVVPDDPTGASGGRG
jgi:class 3 adenylate cyclase